MRHFQIYPEKVKRHFIPQNLSSAVILPVFKTVEHVYLYTVIQYFINSVW
jgi:hypothetical protein